MLPEAGYHVVLKGKLHLSRPVEYNPAMKRFFWSEADVAHMAERYGFQEWNPPGMSDPMHLNDLGGGAIDNDGRFVDGSGTGGFEIPGAERRRRSAVRFLETYDGEKPFSLLVCLVNPHDVLPAAGSRGADRARSLRPGARAPRREPR